MANFLIQTINGQVRHDFSFALIEAIDYQNWLNKGSHEYELSEISKIFEHDYTGYIPSGTIQFAKKFLAAYHDIHKINPINIPKDLMSHEYLKRDITFKLEGTYDFDVDKFVKSDIELKGITEITKKLIVSKDERFLVSDLIEIDSEWRSFIFNSELVGLQNYLGDFTIMPDIKLIKKMISDYKNSPLAYSLDVGINNDGTFLIEVHNLFSVGTYGFSNNRYLPQMIASSFRHLIKFKF